ncbi:outer membrane protein [Helicobacter cetorum]|uniref:outer membrane protein n=1 Tax=Helicobacter cetorum TaxID=138563 RepID=UPI000CF112A7|nr:outer membrane protein [Helicobacter cetorum]
MAGPSGLMTVTSKTLLNALGNSISNSASNQLAGIANIINQRLAHNNDPFTTQQMQVMEQKIIALGGGSDYLNTHTLTPATQIFKNTEKSFRSGLSLGVQILDQVDKINPASNRLQVKQDLQNIANNLGYFLQGAQINISNALSTSYANTLLTNLTALAGKDTAIQGDLQQIFQQYGLKGISINSKGVISIEPMDSNDANYKTSVLGAIANNINGSGDNGVTTNSSNFNSTLTMNLIDSQQKTALENMISNNSALNKLIESNSQANATPTQKAIAQNAQAFKDLILGALNNNAINPTTTALNNLYNALKYQAYGSTIDNYNNLMNQLSQAGADGYNGINIPSITSNGSSNSQIGSSSSATGKKFTAIQSTCEVINGANNSCNPNASNSLAQQKANTQSYTPNTSNGTVQVPDFDIMQQLYNVYQTLSSSQSALQNIAAKGTSTQSQTLKNIFESSTNNGKETPSAINDLLSNIFSNISSVHTTLNNNITSESSILSTVRNFLYGNIGYTTYVTNSNGTKNFNSFNNEGYNNAGEHCNGNSSDQKICAQQLATFNQLINTLSQSTPTNLSDLEKTSGVSLQYTDPKKYYSELQSSLGFTNNNGTISLSSNSSLPLPKIVELLQQQVSKINSQSNAAFGGSAKTTFSDNFDCTSNSTSCTIKGGMAKDLQQYVQDQRDYVQAIKYLTEASQGKLVTTEPTSDDSFLKSVYSSASALQTALKTNNYDQNKGITNGLLDFFNNLHIGSNLQSAETEPSAISNTLTATKTENTFVPRTDVSGTESNPHTLSSFSVTCNTNQDSQSQCSGGQFNITVGDKQFDIKTDGTLTTTYKLINGSAKTGTYGNQQTITIPYNENPSHNKSATFSQTSGHIAFELNNGAKAEVEFTLKTKDGQTHTETYMITENNGKLEVETNPATKVEGATTSGDTTTIDKSTITVTNATKPNPNNTVVTTQANTYSSISATQDNAAQQLALGLSSETGKSAQNGLIQLLGAIPTSGFSNTNETINLLGQVVAIVSGFNNAISAESYQMTEINKLLGQIATSVKDISQNTNPDKIEELLRDIAKNTNTVQVFNQNLKDLLGTNANLNAINQVIENYKQQLGEIQALANAYGSNPFFEQYTSGKSTQHGMSNGFGVNIGYKHFFGQSRNLGLRYYGFFDYGYTQMGIGPQTSRANIFVYGAGTDFLWNIFRRTYHTKAVNFGFFFGVQLAGASWASSLRNQIIANWGNAKDIQNSHFQFLFNLGLRTNFAEFKRFAGRHGNKARLIQQGLEFGVKIPTINQQYFQSAGADVSYRRLYTFYINYIAGF